MEIACDIAGEPLQQVQHGAQRATHNDLTPRRASKCLDTCTSGQVTNIRIGNEHPDRLLSYPDTHNLSAKPQPICLRITDPRTISTPSTAPAALAPLAR